MKKKHVRRYKHSYISFAIILFVILIISLFIFGLRKTHLALANISLDTTFGTNGIVITSFGHDANPSRMALQTDGKILVVGNASNGTMYGWSITRYNTNGVLDTTFGTNGIVTKFFDGNSGLNAVVLQTNGKIVVGGYSFHNPTVCSRQPNFTHNQCWTVARYNIDGTLDTTFGNGGIVYSDVRDGTDPESASALTIQSDGKIVAVGTAYDLGVVRYNTDGSTDFSDLIVIPNSFSFPATFFPNMPAGELNANGTVVAIEQNGDILVAGNADSNHIFLLSLTSNNNFDTTYGDKGLFQTSVQSNSNVNSMVLQQDGKSVVVGQSCSSPCAFTNTYLIRVSTAGAFDTSFGSAGTELTNFSSGNRANTVLLEPSDNKIIIGGNLGSSFALFRFNTDGSLDTMFGTNGTFTPSIEQGGYVHDIALQSDNKLVTTGNAANGSYNDWGLFRTMSLNTYSLSGTVFVDANKNQIQDPGEAGYQGATITLNTGQSTTTDSNGNYSFPSLAAGSYTETLTLPNGYTATTTNSVNISFTANTAVNFGIIPNPPSVGSITLSPNPVAINSVLTASAPFTDPVTNYTDTASWKWGDGNTTPGSVTESNGSGSVSNNHTYTSLGSFTITLKVIDNIGQSGTSNAVIAVIPVGGLSGGNLQDINYSGASLNGQNISNSNLKNAIFNNANLTGANLTGSNLSSANLTSVNFTNATLINVNLKNANLTNANFTGANLTGVNPNGTTITGVTWSNTTCPDGTNSNNDGNTCVGHGF